MQQKFKCPRCGTVNNIDQDVCQMCRLPIPPSAKLPSRFQSAPTSRTGTPRTPIRKPPRLLSQQEIGRTPTLASKPDAEVSSKEGIYRNLTWIFGIFTVLAFIWGIYTYYSSIEKRDLVYAINPIPSIVVSGQACHEHGIAVSYHGEELGCVDISIAQITILNKGKKSIEQADFLQGGIYIQTVPARKVLDAQVIRVSRKQTEFEVIAPSDSWKDGQVPLNWRILEENDGAVIQLIYLGPPEVELSLIANIKEISKVRQSDWKTWSSNTTKW